MPSESPVTKVEIGRSSKDGQWYMRAKGVNNKILWDAEGHENYGDALDIAYRSFPSARMVKIETVNGKQIEEDVSVEAQRIASAEGEGSHGTGGEAEGDGSAGSV